MELKTMWLPTSEEEVHFNTFSIVFDADMNT